MIDIVKLLKQNKDITDFKVNSTVSETYENFYVKGTLETVRATSTEDAIVTVYVDGEDVKKTLASFKAEGKEAVALSAMNKRTVDLLYDKIFLLLKEKLDIPFLFLAGGECRILRRIGGRLGCCTYLCVHEYDELATPTQPLLKDMVSVRKLI